jgi:hypothetical protein
VSLESTQPEALQRARIVGQELFQQRPEARQWSLAICARQANTVKM